MVSVSKARKKILVTGATGFIGKHLLGCLSSKGDLFSIAAVRQTSSLSDIPEHTRVILVGDILSTTDWTLALDEVDTVVHLAARVHVMHETTSNPLQAFRTVNTEGTLHLARQAAIAGVRRFLYLSSIKVNGEQTQLQQPFCADDLPLLAKTLLKGQESDGKDGFPVDPYARSKYEAEKGLYDIARQTGMDIVVIRPPLVYGHGVKANFLSLMTCLDKGIPLPLGAIHNQRSFVAVENLNDLLLTCIDHPAAANQTFLVSDGEDLSTTDLLRRLAQALGKPARLLPIPQKLLTRALNAFGKHAIAERLCGNLQVDIKKNRDLIGWAPPIGVNEGLRRAAEGFQRKANCFENS